MSGIERAIPINDYIERRQFLLSVSYVNLSMHAALTFCERDTSVVPDSISSSGLRNITSPYVKDFEGRGGILLSFHDAFDEFDMTFIRLFKATIMEFEKAFPRINAHAW
jgi:hypothetical protein